VLALVMVAACLLCCMVYSELSSAADYAGALIAIADEQGAETGYDPSMTAEDLPRIFIDKYDIFLHADHPLHSVSLIFTFPYTLLAL